MGVSGPPPVSNAVPTYLLILIPHMGINPIFIRPLPIL